MAKRKRQTMIDIAQKTKDWATWTHVSAMVSNSSCTSGYVIGYVCKWICKYNLRGCIIHLASIPMCFVLFLIVLRFLPVTFYISPCSIMKNRKTKIPYCRNNFNIIYQNCRKRQHWYPWGNKGNSTGATQI
jgi:hypothetical protein